MNDPRPLRLLDRVVLITGAGSGIGRETALRAAGEGADIAAIDLDVDRLDRLVDEVRATGRRAEARVADVSDDAALTAAVDDLVSALGSLHVAFANAGALTHRTTITSLDLAEWNRVLAVDLTGVMLTFRAAVKHFGPDGGCCWRVARRWRCALEPDSCRMSQPRPASMRWRAALPWSSHHRACASTFSRPDSLILR